MHVSMIQIGSTWNRKRFPDDDPFTPTKIHPPAVILEIKDGWVRYSLGDGLEDMRMKIKDFRVIYEEEADVQQR